ncbi:hypothetical protein CASFOL_032148 [Castilleja foliolosa]|uniref:Senescence regulator S40 n=1 Tax=Castilleja foliolosa TaxID=1961234 RepID=A0ABD3C1B4_9LAMI
MALTARKSHRYLAAAAAVQNLNPDLLELNETDVWSINHNDVVLPDTHPKVSNYILRPTRQPYLRIGPKSLPVNIPDWSILGGEYKPRVSGDGEDGWCGDDDVEEESGNDRIPPHEYLARNRVASLSVHEGIGRTLKGRDLSRVRNAIWKKIGFED